MTVTLTSPVLGKAVGETYTGNLEDWLCAEGYVRKAGYTGPGVSNTGPTDVVPAKDPGLASNRGDKAHWPVEPEKQHAATIANDTTNLTKAKFPAKFDFDLGGTEDDAPSDVTFEPKKLVLAGGAVTALGDNLVGVTAVTVGGTAVTNLVTTDAAKGKITFTAPAKTAGAYDVVLTDASGNLTVTGGLTYAA